MRIQRIAGSMLIIGSLLFFIAAFSPIAQVFSEPDAAKKLEILMNGRMEWSFDQIFFALGALITAGGLYLTAKQLQNIPGSGWAFLGVALIVIGAVLWSWDVYLRGINPQAFIQGAMPTWPFIAYTVLTQAGLAAVGSVLIRSTLPGWVGWVLIGGSLLFFLVYLILKDMPPFAYYILTLSTGIMMVIRKEVKYGQILFN
jgi:hypothetical protein